MEPRARGAGLGRRLVLEAYARARAMGVDRLTLRVCVRWDRAIALYGALGFEAFGREPEALEIETERLDELHMTVALNRLGGTAPA